jgi:hypothetical protein
MFKTILLTWIGYSSSKILSTKFPIDEFGEHKRESAIGIIPLPTHAPLQRYNPKYYEDESHADGVVTQAVTLLQPLAN